MLFKNCFLFIHTVIFSLLPASLAYVKCVPGAYCDRTTAATQGGNYPDVQSCVTQCVKLNLGFQYFTFVVSGQNQCLCSKTCAVVSPNPNTDTYCNSPTYVPTRAPSSKPTVTPSRKPTASPSLSLKPTVKPSTAPSFRPTASPSVIPTAAPSRRPTAAPSRIPTASPSWTPTNSPSRKPTASPSTMPTVSPSKKPTVSPSWTPTAKPSIKPTSAPSWSMAPSWTPTRAPSWKPTVSPSRAPTASPSRKPSASPSRIPTAAPSAKPSFSPTFLDTQCWINSYCTPTSSTKILGTVETKDSCARLCLNNNPKYNFINLVNNGQCQCNIGCTSLIYAAKVNVYSLYGQPCVLTTRRALRG